MWSKVQLAAHVTPGIQAVHGFIPLGLVPLYALSQPLLALSLLTEKGLTKHSFPSSDREIEQLFEGSRQAIKHRFKQVVLQFPSRAQLNEIKDNLQLCAGLDTNHEHSMLPAPGLSPARLVALNKLVSSCEGQQGSSYACDRHSGVAGCCPSSFQDGADPMASCSDCSDVAGAKAFDSCVGQPLGNIIQRMVHDTAAGDFAAPSTSSCPSYACSYDQTYPAPAAGGRFSAEFAIAWPPTIPVGSMPEAVELRAEVAVDVATAAGAEQHPAYTPAAAAAASAAAAACCCGRLLVVQEDVVVQEEGFKVEAGRGRVRVRLNANRAGVTSCILASKQGVPTVESLQGAAPLVGLPQPAREEAHRLLWRMMHEALPPNASTIPFDADAFSSTFDTQPPRLQAALSWAWAQHFTAFANDFNYLLECLPYSAAAAAGTDSPAAAAAAAAAAAEGTADAAAAAAGGEASDEELERYQAVLAQMVGFLRDNEMFACLATLLQNAVSRGLVLVRHGEVCGMSPRAAAAVAAFSTPLVLDTETASEPGTPVAAAAAFGGNRNGALAAALAALTAAVAAGSGAAGGDDADDAAGSTYGDRLSRSGSGSLASWYGDSVPPSPYRTPCGAPAKPEEPEPNAAFSFTPADSAASASASAASVETPATHPTSVATKTARAAAPAASSRLAAAAVPLLLLVLLALFNAFLCGGARAAASARGSAVSIRRAVSALALLPLAVKAAAALLLPLAAAGSTHAGEAPTAKSGYVRIATVGAMRMAGGCERWAVAVALSAAAWRVAGAVEGAEGSSSICAW